MTEKKLQASVPPEKKCLINKLLNILPHLIPRVFQTSWLGGCRRIPRRSWWWWPSRGRWAWSRTWCRARPSPQRRPGPRRWASPWWPPASAAPAPCSWQWRIWVSECINSNLETWNTNYSAIFATASGIRSYGSLPSFHLKPELLLLRPRLPLWCTL